MLVRVTEPSGAAFQLRKGEHGVSVFDTAAIEPPLTEMEVLNSFRPGSQVVRRSVAEVQAKGLEVVPIAGAESLPVRLREAHAELRPGPGMTRVRFKQALRELE